MDTRHRAGPRDAGRLGRPGWALFTTSPRRVPESLLSFSTASSKKQQCVCACQTQPRAGLGLESTSRVKAVLRLLDSGKPQSDLFDCLLPGPPDKIQQPAESGRPLCRCLKDLKKRKNKEKEKKRVAAAGVGILHLPPDACLN